MKTRGAACLPCLFFDYGSANGEAHCSVSFCPFLLRAFLTLSYTIKGLPDVSAKLFQTSKTFLFFELTFPNGQNSPTRLLQLLIICLITLDVSVYFLPPKIRIVLRPDKVFTAIMLMPEATVYKHNRFVFWQDDIRFSGQAWIVLSISETVCKQEFANKFFRLCVLAMYAGHIVVPNCRGMDIRQAPHPHHQGE